jgi:hypothetical protein
MFTHNYELKVKPIVEEDAKMVKMPIADQLFSDMKVERAGLKTQLKQLLWRNKVLI